LTPKPWGITAQGVALRAGNSETIQNVLPRWTLVRLTTTERKTKKTRRGNQLTRAETMELSELEEGNVQTLTKLLLGGKERLKVLSLQSVAEMRGVRLP